MIVIGVDLYNQTLTGTASKTLNAIRSDSDHTPVVIINNDMQNTTGTLSPGAHAGSYNGQDAYNDMLITDGSKSNRKRTTSSNTDDNNIERSGLYARSTGNSNRGGA